MPEFPDISGFLLAGGKSTRMGRDKALLEIGGETLLERLARLLTPLVASLTVLGAPERYARFGLEVLPDAVAEKGPLAGLVTGLRASAATWGLFVACDLPYLDARFLRFLLGQARNVSEDAIVPETAHGLQPLCALYRRTCLPVFERALAGDNAAIVHSLAALRVRRLDRALLKKFAFAETLFENINTPEDYQRARRVWEAMRE